MKKILFILLCLFTVSSVLGQNKKLKMYSHKGWIDFNKNGVKDIYEDPSQPIEKRVEDLLSRMTMEEKTCQLGTIYGYGAVLKDTLPTKEWEMRVWKDGIGNIDEHLNGEWKKTSLEYPYSNHTKAMNEVQSFFVEKTRLGIPADMTNEGIRGLKHKKSTFFPAQIGLGATWNRKLINEIGVITGAEAKALGYTNVYSPILDLARDQRWGRVVETYGEDPYLAGQLGYQQVVGIQSNRVVSTPKHFSVYGIPAGGRDGWSRTDPHASPQEVHQLHLEPFRVAFQEAGALGTMASHNDYNGTPISGSYYFMTELLRNQWGFKGYVVSDSWSLDKANEFYHVTASEKESVALELNAGLNVHTFFKDPEDFITPLREAVQEGLVTSEMLDQRVREVLYVKFWLGLFDTPYTENKFDVNKFVNNNDHRDVSLRSARESIVLLKNNNNRLPLSKDIKSVAVIGPLADEVKSLTSRYGSIDANVITGLQGVKEYVQDGVNVLYAKGCTVRDSNFPASDVMYFPISNDEQAQIDEAVAIARQAEVALIYVGDDNRTIGESRTRVSLDLAGRQKELIRAVQATGTPVVLVLFNGRPITLNWEDANVDAIVEAWFPGEFSGQAVAEVLFGAYNPGGKLSTTFPKSVGQIPWAFPFKHNTRGKGYARVDGHLYPFGFGLSYTTFEISDLNLDASTIKSGDVLKVSCKVKNTGTRKGDEIVQVYLMDDISSISRYVKELCGFERVSLEPGEEKVIKFEVTPRSYGMYNSESKFVIEPGKFVLYVGNSSEDTPLKTDFYVE